MNNTIDIHSRNTPTIHQLRRAGWKVRVIHGFSNSNLPFAPVSSKDQKQK